MLKPKVGDMVTLKPMLVRERNQKGFWTGKLDEGYKYFLDEEAVSIEARALQVGDKVKDWDNAQATVLAFDGEEAWLKAEDGTHWTGRLSDLTRVEDKP